MGGSQSYRPWGSIVSCSALPAPEENAEINEASLAPYLEETAVSKTEAIAFAISADSGQMILTMIIDSGATNHFIPHKSLVRHQLLKRSG